MIGPLFIQLVTVSLQASLMIICIWFLRLSFRRWLSPQWIYVLWILLLLKLTLPWLPESPLSMERWLPSLSFEESIPYHSSTSRSDMTYRIQAVSNSYD